VKISESETVENTDHCVLIRI